MQNGYGPMVRKCGLTTRTAAAGDLPPLDSVTGSDAVSDTLDGSLITW